MDAYDYKQSDTDALRLCSVRVARSTLRQAAQALRSRKFALARGLAHDAMDAVYAAHVSDEQHQHLYLRAKSLIDYARRHEK